MKYDVKFSCGHIQTVDLFGKADEREKKINYFEKYCDCQECYDRQKNIENSAGCEEVEMSYREYKTNYSECKTKVGSYNGYTKTIVVYVPSEETQYLNRKLGNYLITVQFKLANTGIIESNGIKSYESIDVSEAIPSGYSLAFALGGYTGDNQFHFFGLFANPIKNTITAYIGNSSNTADSGDPIVILVCLKN